MKRKIIIKVSFGVCLVFIFVMASFYFMDTPRMATAAESTTWRIATIQSPKYQIVQELESSFNKITELTKGRIKFQVHYGSESGFKANQYISMLEKGMMDGALVPVSTVAGQYPWLGAFGIPFICPDPKILFVIFKHTIY